MARARHPTSHKGRGAVSNSGGRFQRDTHEVFDDGWGSANEEPEAPETTLTPDPARRLITRNNSPDIPFEASINPYKGCEHGCPYCLDGDTPVLMADGSHHTVADLKVGDAIIGTSRAGHYRYYVRTRVLAHWQSEKPAYRVTLADGTTIVASADHRFLTERGWKHVANTPPGERDRMHLTTNNKLMGTGAFAVPPTKDASYRVGYLCGMIRGDGHQGSYHYERAGRRHGDVHRFRLALADVDALNRSRRYLNHFAIATQVFAFQAATHKYRKMSAIRVSTAAAITAIRGIIAWPEAPDLSWHKGFIAGIFDAEGHFGAGTVRIKNTDPGIVTATTASLQSLGFRYQLELATTARGKPLTTIRLVGGLREQLRLFHTVDPAIQRKLDFTGQAVKGQSPLQVQCVEPLDKRRTMYDITTGTGDFIANGVISHNCFARPSHSYLDLSPGLDFETRIFYKENAAEKLEAELRKPGYEPTPISLGINTDAYQPAERRLRVTRSILEVLYAYRHPVSLLTKSALIQRDLDLITAMAEQNLVSCAISITTLDPGIKRALEPRTASPAARLNTVQALAEAGVPTSVMTAPIIPALTDYELEAILEAAAAHGASGAGYVLLRLPWEVKDVFREWLETHYPGRADHVMSLVQQSRGGKDYDAAWGQRMTGTGQFAELIAQRFRLACRRYGLDTHARRPLDCAQFRLPGRPGDQLDLL